MKLKKNIKSILKESLSYKDYNKKSKNIIKKLLKKKRINKKDKNDLIIFCSFYFNDDNFNFSDLKNTNF